MGIAGILGRVSTQALSRIRAVFFDFYGTLVDLNDDVRSTGFDDLISRLGVSLGPGELFRQYMDRISVEQDASQDESGFAAYRDSWVQAGNHLLGVYDVPDPGRQFAETYADLHANAVAFPEVPHALGHCGTDSRAPSWPMPIMTSWPTASTGTASSSTRSLIRRPCVATNPSR